MLLCKNVTKGMQFELDAKKEVVLKSLIPYGFRNGEVIKVESVHQITDECWTMMIHNNDDTLIYRLDFLDDNTVESKGLMPICS